MGRGLRDGDRPSDPRRAAIVDDLHRLSDLIRHIEEREAETAVSDTTPRDPGAERLAELRVRRTWLRQPFEAIAEVVKLRAAKPRPRTKPVAWGTDSMRDGGMRHFVVVYDRRSDLKALRRYGAHLHSEASAARHAFEVDSGRRRARV